MLLRNETQATARRVQRAKVKSGSRKSGQDTTSNESDSPQMALVSRDPSPSPTFSLYERAAHHFVSNYVLVPPQGTERGYLEFLIPLIRAKDPDPHFKLAFEACALASFGNRVGHGSQLEEEALGTYTKALKMTVKAIRDPLLSKQDSTVVAVLLLGLFESISSRHIGLLAWKSHTEGAIKLVQDRGPEQLRTKQGKDIFVSVRTQYVSSTLFIPRVLFRCVLSKLMNIASDHPCFQLWSASVTRNRVLDQRGDKGQVWNRVSEANAPHYRN